MDNSRNTADSRDKFYLEVQIIKLIKAIALEDHDEPEKASGHL